jgi:hypothetical protein
MINPLFGGEKGGQMVVAIRVVIDLKDDEIDLKEFLDEFKKHFDEKLFVKECEYEKETICQ